MGWFIKLVTGIDFDGKEEDKCNKPHFAAVSKEEAGIVRCNMITHSPGKDRIPLKQEDTTMPIDDTTNILTKKATAQVVLNKKGQQIVVGEISDDLSDLLKSLGKKKKK